MKTIYVLNPEYRLKLDKNRVIIINRSGDPIADSFIGFVHPVYAVLLALFDGQKQLGEIISNASALLGMESKKVSNIITPLLENEESVHFHFDGNHLSFPNQLLVPKVDGISYEALDPESFFIPKNHLDMESARLHTPLDALFMINTLCITDCIYCYADRKQIMDCLIPFPRLQELIGEAKALGMRSFDITGGEFFLYKHWEALLIELLDNGFEPYISTKCPIEEDTIAKLEQIGHKKIQISIDTVVKDELMMMCNVAEDYHQRLLKTFDLLDHRGFEISTNSQITSYNQDSTGELIDYLLTLKNIKRINMGVAGLSLYRGDRAFREYRPNLDTVKKIQEKVDVLKEKYEDSININFSGYSTKLDFFGKSIEEKKKNYYDRARCSGNFYSFILLPDGKVTICEELYWHPRFIIGDLTKQSISEMWNSERALELYNISPAIVREESECKNCKEFEPCHKYSGVCWKDILYAYGDENWDYPDPKCPWAREPIREFYI